MEGVYWGWREFTRSLLGLGEFTGGLGSLRGVYWALGEFTGGLLGGKDKGIS